MSFGGPHGTSFNLDVKPHAYDPLTEPEFFEDVLARRVIAFFIDAAIIIVPVILAAIFIFLFGLVTLSLGWALFWLLGPGALIWAVAYYGITLGSSCVSHPWHAGGRNRGAHLVRGALLCPSGRRTGRGILDFRLLVDAFDSAGGVFQRARAAVARSPSRHRGDKQ